MTDKTQPITHAEITAPISADMRRIEQSAARAANRDTHFYLAGWNGARGNEASHEHFRRALQAAPTAPAAVPVLFVSPAQLEKHLDLEGAENAEAGRYLPARKTLAGKFTQPLYAHAPAPAAVAVPAPLAAGMKVAADLVQEQADLYIAEHAETDPDTGAVIWHHREYGFDWHNGLEELAQKLLARAALTAAPAQAVAQGITIDFKQATELLEMFGGEPTEITLMTGDGHSGNGLYASYTDMPEQGAGFLGTSDDEALPAAPAQEHATQLADQGRAYSIDADPEGIRARVAEAITSALASGVKKSDRPSHEHWLRPFWMHAYFAVVQHNALRDSAEAMLNAPGALTQAARDVLAERARQVDAEGFNHARDDEYVGRQLAGAAASYLILAAGGREEDARAVWPWRKEWLKPSDQRRYLEKACALALAEMERLDRATARAAKGEA